MDWHIRKQGIKYHQIFSFCEDSIQCLGPTIDTFHIALIIVATSTSRRLDHFDAEGKPRSDVSIIWQYSKRVMFKSFMILKI